MLVSRSADLQGITHDILKKRFQHIPDSVDKCTDEAKVAYVGGLRQSVSLGVSNLALFGISKVLLATIQGNPAAVLVASIAPGALFGAAMGQAFPQPENNAQWFEAVKRGLSLYALKQLYELYGAPMILPILHKSFDLVCPAFSSRATKQMSFIVVINETDYAFELSDSYDMIGDLPAAKFDKLAAREIGHDGDYVSWGVWATGSGSASGSASSINLKTILSPRGGQDFYFIVSSACPA